MEDRWSNNYSKHHSYLILPLSQDNRVTFLFGISQYHKWSIFLFNKKSLLLFYTPHLLYSLVTPLLFSLSYLTLCTLTLSNIVPKKSILLISGRKEYSKLNISFIFLHSMTNASKWGLVSIALCLYSQLMHNYFHLKIDKC